MDASGGEAHNKAHNLHTNIYPERQMQSLRKTLLPASLPILCAMSFTLPVFAQVLPAPTMDVLSLDASAASEVVYDQASTILAYDAQGTASAELIDAASRAIDTALKEAKMVKEVSARTGQFTSNPVYGKDQQVTGWRVRAELVLDSSDFKALSALSGKLSSRLAIASVNYSLSTASRKAVEKKLIGEAIAAYREKAQAAALAFGYAGFRVREVAVNSGGGPQPRAVEQRRFLAMAAASEPAPIPIEAGRGTVSVSVTGSVQMQK